MAREPTTDDINQFCEFTGLDAERDRMLVVSALKSNNTMEQLLTDYFDDSISFRKKHTWDDSVFAADREGGTNNAGIAFNVEAPDNAVIQGVTPPPEKSFYGPAGAPSRPPSRTNNRSPLGRVIDWTAGDSSGVPNSAAQEEEDLQRALRESAVESGFTPQEAGVTDPSANATYFGPANRADYDQNSWALVPTAADTAQTQADIDPAPSARKREQGAPAFLVQQPNARNQPHRLGSILTILHEIPLARNVLLSTGNHAASYGHNSEWWKGQPIYPPHILAAMQQGELQCAEDARPNFHEEIHRLMAFLDQTERSYGSVEAMAELVPGTAFSIERQFYDTLNETTLPEIMKPLTHLAYPISVETLEDAQESTRFAFLNFELTKSQYEQTKTLYEAWDWLVWNEAMVWSEINAETKMVVLDDMGEVMTIVIDGDGPPESMEIPEVWYPERYLQDRKQEAKVIQEHLAWVFRGLYQIESLTYEYSKWVDPKTNKVYEKREMLEKTIKEYESHVQYLDGLGRFRELQNSNDDEKQYTRLEDVPCIKTQSEEVLSKNSEQVVQRCKWLLSDIDQKMDQLNWERERLQERQRFLGTLLTDPNKAALPKPFVGKKYLLRGVATARDVTYVCRRAEPNLIELDETPNSVDQWWRLAYNAGEAQPVKTEKVSIELVKRQIFSETKNPVLVYATETAVDTPAIPLPDSLQRFVRAENKGFRQELNQESTDDGAYMRASNMSPISPSKRKYRSGSVDSMATNRASLGGSDMNSRAGDFDMDAFGDGDRDGSMDTEMADFSTRQSVLGTHSVSMAEVMFSEKAEEQAGSCDTHKPAPDLGDARINVSANGFVDVSRTITPDMEEQPKAPEMQERNNIGSSSPFMTRHFSTAHDPRDEQKTIKMMDMEIPDEH